MLSRIFVTADLHLGHKNIVTFTDGAGNKLRPWDNVEEMNAALISNWNSVVGCDDIVYVLGDFAMGDRKASVPLAQQLKGRKILVAGNHDTAPASLYLENGFENVKACHVFEKKGIILTHIPIHPSQLERWKLNVHGHLHSNTVGREVYVAHGNNIFVEDKHYRCVSVEQTGFKPILLESLL